MATPDTHADQYLIDEVIIYGNRLLTRRNLRVKLQVCSHLGSIVRIFGVLFITPHTLVEEFVRGS